LEYVGQFGVEYVVVEGGSVLFLFHCDVGEAAGGYFKAEVSDF
jgi:hypothetical protein